MDPQDVLLTYAEVSVALAGFIGITAALRGRSSQLAAHDISSIRFVLEVAFSALFLSALPAVLVNLSLPEPAAWRVAGCTLLATLLLALYLLITLGIGVSSVMGVLVPGAYLIGVGMLLVSAAIEFLAFVAGLQE